MVAGVEDEVLLEQDDEPVLDLPAVQVGCAGNSCERLPAMAREDGVNSLHGVRRCSQALSHVRFKFFQTRIAAAQIPARHTAASSP